MIITDLILGIADIIAFAILGRIVVSWLLLAGVRNQFVGQVDYALSLITEPIMRPLRRVVPTFGALDFTPLVAIILLTAILPRILNRLF